MRPLNIISCALNHYCTRFSIIALIINPTNLNNTTQYQTKTIIRILLHVLVSTTLLKTADARKKDSAMHLNIFNTNHTRDKFCTSTQSNDLTNEAQQPALHLLHSNTIYIYPYQLSSTIIIITSSSTYTERKIGERMNVYL